MGFCLLQYVLILLPTVLRYGYSYEYPVPVLTIQSPDGDTIDCMDRLTQPALKNPLLKNHVLQDPEKRFSNLANNKISNWQVWHLNGTRCPDGTIPVRRFTPMKNKTVTSNAGNEATKGHEYAIGFTGGTNYGTRVTMSVWRPKVQDNSGEFSLGQIWITSGSYNDSNLNTMEVGWQVYPGLYFDNQPRFFIFWTRDAYNLTRCYNLECAGFVQTSQNVVIEGAISLVSTFEGNHIDITVQIWKDPQLSLWWLAVGPTNDNALEPVGYWPTEIFTRFTEYAETVQWGGEIVNQNISGRHTTTQMGSGYLPTRSFGKSACMSDIEVAVNQTDFRPPYYIQIKETNPKYYKAKKLSKTSFCYGGQEKARANRQNLDSRLILLIISFLLVV